MQHDRYVLTVVSSLATAIEFKNWIVNKVDECFQLPKVAAIEFRTIVLKVNKEQDKEDLTV